MRSDRTRLADILDAIEQIENHGKDARQGFPIWSR